MANQGSTKRAAFVLANLAGMALAGGAGAQTLSWINAAGGSAATVGNWNPAQLPAATNPLTFGLNAAYPVTFTAGTAQSRSMAFSRGTVTLTMPTHTTGTTSVGSAAGTAAAILTTGIWNTAGFTLGPVFNSSGTLSVNDDDAVLNCAALRVAGDTNLTSALNITNAGVVNASSVVIGDLNPIGVGNVLVSGQPFAIPPLRSTLSATGSMTVGASGVGNLTISSGALANTGGDVIVAERQSPGPTLSRGTVTIGGAGLRNDATLSVGADLRVGRGSVVASDTGDGLVEVNADGRLDVAGATRVGGSGGGTGILRVNSGATVVTHGLFFGSSGDFQHNGGSVTVVGSGFTHDETTLVVEGPGSPLLVLDGLGTTPSFTAASTGAPAVTVGLTGAGAMTLRNGTDVLLSQGGVQLGASAGSSGTLNIESGASLLAQNLGRVDVGRGGAGVLNVRTGGSLTGHALTVAATATSQGTVLVTGPGSSVTAASLAIGGDGAVTISDGGVLSTTGLFTTQVSFSTGGSLTINNATLNATTDVDVEGTLTMTNGTINAREFVASADMSVSGVINAQVRGLGGLITANGDLTLGDGTQSGVLDSLNLAVGEHRVVVRDSFTASLVESTIAGGTLESESSITLQVDGSLTGSGTVVAPLRFFVLGPIVATGPGLTLDSDVSLSNAGALSGTQFTFPAGSKLTMSGPIQSRVVSQPGAKLIFTGNSQLGDGSAAGFTNGGELDVSGSLFINDSSGVQSGSVLTLRSAFVQCPSQITVNATPLQTLRGSGVIAAPLFVSAGVVSPGLVGDDQTGLISITDNADLGLNPNLPGTLQMEIAGLAAVDSDRLAVGGAVHLGGRLELRLLDGFTPANGFTRDLITASGGITGTFAVEDLPAKFHIEYLGGAVRAVYCAADFNNDGFVDFFDFDDFVTAFESGDLIADFNADGFVDFFDFDDFVLSFEEGC
jgi:T5SS/PEP-CTERM-associated repeat protein